jgi:phosphoserine phosphatase
MKTGLTRFHLEALLATLLIFSACSARPVATDPLPSWKGGGSKTAIMQFVRDVTTKGGPDYVAPEARIATFDNDGTLWAEQPLYFQLEFAMDRVRQLAPEHPEWKTTQPFQAVLENDAKALAESGTEGIVKLILATHAGMSTEEFGAIVRDWVNRARHPRFDRPYDSLVYQPMLELLTYLHDNGFQVYICSGGGVEFMRVFAEEVYGIPPERVIGSSIQSTFVLRNGKPVLERQPKFDSLNDKGVKPVNIRKVIGRRPIAAFGNSDGDLAMLQWTAAGAGKRLCLLVHHTDADREWAYDRKSHIGQLDKALDEAKERNWVVADMKRDWLRMFPAATKSR